MSAIIDLLLLYVAVLVVLLFVYTFKYFYRDNYISGFINKENDKYLMHVNFGKHCVEEPDFIILFYYTVDDGNREANIHFDKLIKKKTGESELINPAVKAIKYTIANNNLEFAKAFDKLIQNPSSAIVFNFKFNIIKPRKNNEFKTSDLSVFVEPLGPVVILDSEE